MNSTRHSPTHPILFFLFTAHPVDDLSTSMAGDLHVLSIRRSPMTYKCPATPLLTLVASHSTRASLTSVLPIFGPSSSELGHCRAIVFAMSTILPEQ